MMMRMTVLTIILVRVMAMMMLVVAVRMLIEIKMFPLSSLDLFRLPSSTAEVACSVAGPVAAIASRRGS